MNDEMSEDIIDDDAARVLTYVSAANRGGYAPTQAEVEVWRTKPDRIPGKKGDLITPATPGTPGRLAEYLNPSLSSVSNIIKSMDFSPVYRSYNTQNITRALSNMIDIVGTSGTPAVYGPPGPPEDYTVWLTRLSWLAVDSAGRLRITPLGQALMMTRNILMDNGSSGVVVLAADNEIAYAQLLGHIKDLGETLVVDPYLKDVELTALLSTTDANRFLIGPNIKPGELATMKQVIEQMASPGCQLKQADRGVLHDRFLVGEFDIKALGMSLNSVAKLKSTTILTSIPLITQESLRLTIEDWWSNAKLVIEKQNLDSMQE